MKNCHELSLDFFPLKDDFVYPVPEGLTPKYFAYGAEHLSEEFKEWVKEAKLTFENLLVFVHPVLEEPKKYIHIDATVGEDFVRQYSINWNIEPCEILMEWWESKIPGQHHQGQAKHPYTFYPIEECVKIEESRCTGPVLFRNSVPHSVINTGTAPRFGISARFKEYLDWPTITKHLERYIKV